jgi:hypothetical protein
MRAECLADSPEGSTQFAYGSAKTQAVASEVSLFLVGETTAEAQPRSPLDRRRFSRQARIARKLAPAVLGLKTAVSTDRFPGFSVVQDSSKTRSTKKKGGAKAARNNNLSN